MRTKLTTHFLFLFLFVSSISFANPKITKDQDPEIIEHHYIILLQNGNSDEAKFILEQSIKNNPTSKKLHILLDDSENAAISL